MARTCDSENPKIMLVRESNKLLNCACLVLLLTSVFVMPVAVYCERLPIKSYSTGDGLARDQANRIVRDSRGFLWFCTLEGLSRFDGYTFTNYGVDQGLPNSQVNDFLETRAGLFWVATSGGLCRFNSNAPSQSTVSSEPRFQIYKLSADPASQNVTALYEDHAGRIWCGTTGGLYRLEQHDDQLTNSLVDLHQPSDIGYPGVISILEDRRGSVWVSTGRGLYRIKTDGIIERYGTQEGLPVRNFTPAPLLEDREDHIWVGTGVGLYQLVSSPEPNRPIVARIYTTKDGLANNSISYLFQASDGKLWVGNWSALSERLGASGKDGKSFKKYTAANGVGDVIALGEDRDGNLWIGTASHGAIKIARSGFTGYDEADGLGGSRIGQISEDRATEFCVFGTSTAKGYVNRWDGSRFFAVELTLPKGVNYSWGWYQNILQDEYGEWWMASASGLVRYPKIDPLEKLSKAVPKAVYTTSNGLGGNEVFRVFEDSRSDIWVSSVGIGQNLLSRWDRSSGTFRIYDESYGLPATAPSAFREDVAGNLWIGFYGGGVARYRDGHFKFFGADAGVPKGFIRALYLDNAGRLWIATTEGGVARIDDTRAETPALVRYSTANGLTSNHTTCLTEDQWGRIYIGTGRGVDQLDPLSGRIKHYTTADGLANNYVNVSLRDRTGALWFGTLDGLSKLIPQPERPEQPPPILISGLRIAGVEQAIADFGETNLSGFKLEANQSQLQIDFLGLSFAPGGLLRYQYKLEGADTDWSPLTEQRSITYANLSHGAYRFIVRAVSAEGLASVSPAVLGFTILPPLWQRWWFVAIVATLIIALAYALYRFRVSRLLELERVRTRIATDLHDDIGSSLSQVSVLSEVIRRQLGPSPVISEPLSMIGTLARDVVDSMNDIVWAINPRRDHLSDLTQRMRRFASDVFTARDIKFSFRGPDGKNDVSLGADIRREVFLIFKESVNNVARHSACTEATVEFLVRDGSLELTVQDNGRGFDVDRTGDGNGLSSMRQRALRIGGALEINSSNGPGTIVKLRARHAGNGWMRRYRLLR